MIPLHTFCMCSHMCFFLRARYSGCLSDWR
nr:MAG TPA_asm: hypothetical protein [Caudoviricetes sp.]